MGGFQNEVLVNESEEIQTLPRRLMGRIVDSRGMFAKGTC